MTAPEGTTWCDSCGVHRTRFAGHPCPCCTDDKPATVPPPRMYFDRDAPITTTAGEA